MPWSSTEEQQNGVWIAPAVVVARDGRTALLVESLHRILPVAHLAATQLSFVTRQSPEARATHGLDVYLEDQIRSDLQEILSTFSFKVPRDDPPERRLVEVALTAIAFALSEARAKGEHLSEVRQGVRWLRELAAGPRASDEEAVRYIEAKVFWGWKYDQTSIGFDWFDSMVLGVPPQGISRISQLAEGEYITRKPLPGGAATYAPTKRLMRGLPTAATASGSKPHSARSKRSRVLVTAFESYTVGRQLGEGVSGWVYEARDSRDNPCAVKILNPARATAERRKRFQNEVEFSSRNRHRNILTVLDHGATTLGEELTPFYAMPLYDGSLRNLMKAGIPAAKVLPYFNQILDGVEAAHLAEVFHRDLKPENILYSKSNDTLIVADFGIAHFEEEELYTAVETGPAERLANFQYAAPEQRNRGGHVDKAADTWALGLILNELFTGEVPQGVGIKTVASVAPQYSYLDALVDEMRQQDPHHRPDSIAKIKEALIARGLDFVSQQKIDALKQTVVPETELDDPLVAQPPELVGAHWEDGRLSLTLSKSVNDTWVWALQNMGSYSSVMRKDPKMFRFIGNTGYVPCDAAEAQHIVDHFKGWLPKANAVYRMRVETDQRKAIDAERERLRRELEAEETKRRVNRELHL